MEASLKEKKRQQKKDTLSFISSYLPVYSVDIVVGVSAPFLGHELMRERWSKKLKGEWVLISGELPHQNLSTTNLLSNK